MFCLETTGRLNDIIKGESVYKFSCVQNYKYSGTSPLRTLWDLDFSPYYRGVLNSEVT